MEKLRRRSLLFHKSFYNQHLEEAKWIKGVTVMLRRGVLQYTLVLSAKLMM